jgi:hypothetical protein
VRRGDLRYVDMARDVDLGMAKDVDLGMAKDVVAGMVKDVDLGMAKDVVAGMVKAEDGETEVQSDYFPRVHNGYKKDMDKNNKNIATSLVNNMS